MTNREKAIMTYNAIQERKKRETEEGERQAVAFRLEGMFKHIGDNHRHKRY